MLKKKKKGEYGYLKYNQRFNLVIGVCCAVTVAVLVAIGYLIFRTKLNVLMIPAMLCVIPTANYLVTYLAIVMFDTAPQEKYDTIKAFDDAGMLLSDLIVVDEKGGRDGLDFAVVYKNGIIGYQSTKKDGRDMIEITVNGTLKRKSIPMRIKVYRDWNDFVRRISDAELPGDEEAQKRIDQGKETLLSCCM